MWRTSWTRKSAGVASAVGSVLKSSRHSFVRDIAIANAAENARGRRCARRRVRKEQFRLLQGESLIRVYRKGESAVKAFCINCCSSLFGGDWPEGDEVSIRMGAFDDDPGVRPQYHTFVEDRAPWGEITDDLPQCRGVWNEDAGPPKRG
jgi:hypothetical protein